MNKIFEWFFNIENYFYYRSEHKKHPENSISQQRLDEVYREVKKLPKLKSPEITYGFKDGVNHLNMKFREIDVKISRHILLDYYWELTIKKNGIIIFEHDILDTPPVAAIRFLREEYDIDRRFSDSITLGVLNKVNSDRYKRIEKRSEDV